MYVLAFGEKNGKFFEGVDPPWPPRKNSVSQRKKIKEKIFALDPQFLILYYIIFIIYNI